MLENPIMLAFNRGIISSMGLARTDLKRTSLSAQEQTNWLPRTLGPMMLRPGLGYIYGTDGNNQAEYIPFVFSKSDTALIEFTNGKMRVSVNETIITRASVSTAFTNGAFTSNLTGWTDNDETGGTSAWVTGGYMGLTGNGTAAAIREQQLTVAGGDQSVEHALNITIERGPVTLRVGSSSGDDDYIAETTLLTGYHSLAFTPTGASVYVEFSSRLDRQVLVDSVAVASSGQMELTSPFLTADLRKIRYAQSADVIFIACDGYHQKRIERRATNSWSIVDYHSDDGPYRLLNSGPITIAASALTGNITLTASAALFDSNHVGALWRISSAGQRVTANVSAENNFTDSIRVSSTGSGRQFTIEIAGTWAGRVTLQRSIDDDTSWEDVSGSSWVGNTTTTYNDGLDNQIVYYRLGIKTGDYTSGTAELALDYAVGSITGIVRITNFTSATSVGAEVIRDLGGTAASSDWQEGAWSDYRGWPSAVCLYEGRLWWLGKDKCYGSVSDAFTVFDPDTEGDSGPIDRSIGEGPVDTINWALPLMRLVIGGGAAEYSVKSSSFDEPITPTAFNLKPSGTQGSAQVAPVRMDSSGLFVQGAGTKVFELQYDGNVFDYVPRDMTAIAPEIGEPSIVKLVIQRQPDTRIHAVLSDGTVAILVRDRAEEVLAWIKYETSGASGQVEDAVVLPGDEEDKVYYVVKRTVNSSTVRYLEKFALERECLGETHTYSGASTTDITGLPFRNNEVVTVFDSDFEKIENLTVSSKAVTLSAATTDCYINPAVIKCADSYITFSQVASSTVSGLDHLEGEDVVVFADGLALEDANDDIATFTVTSGSISVTHHGEVIQVEEGCVGLAYRARFKSSKLAYQSQVGTALSQSCRITRIGMILLKTHNRGVKYGQDYDTMEEMPRVEDGVNVEDKYLWPEYDKASFAFPGHWSVDARICLEANAPRCAMVVAIPFVMEKFARV